MERQQDTFQNCTVGCNRGLETEDARGFNESLDSEGRTTSPPSSTSDHTDSKQSSLFQLVRVNTYRETHTQTNTHTARNRSMRHQEHGDQTKKTTLMSDWPGRYRGGYDTRFSRTVNSLVIDHETDTVKGHCTHVKSRTHAHAK